MDKRLVNSRAHLLLRAHTESPQSRHTGRTAWMLLDSTPYSAASWGVPAEDCPTRSDACNSHSELTKLSSSRLPGVQSVLKAGKPLHLE